MQCPHAASQELLEDPVSTKLDKALVDLVQSNVLPSEDKVSVGTIRRLVVMFGSLSVVLRAVGNEGKANAKRFGISFQSRSLAAHTLRAMPFVGSERAAVQWFCMGVKSGHGGIDPGTSRTSSG